MIDANMLDDSVLYVQDATPPTVTLRHDRKAQRDFVAVPNHLALEDAPWAKTSKV